VTTEHQIQAAFFERLSYSPYKEYPIFAVPNFAGHHGSAVARMRSGARAKAEGRRKGVPDIVFAFPASGYHGLFVECKTDKGHLQPEQRAWLQTLATWGYAVAVCRSADEIWHAFSRYRDSHWTEADQWQPGRKRR
jgi:hypothetical protein